MNINGHNKPFYLGKNPNKKQRKFLGKLFYHDTEANFRGRISFSLITYLLDLLP